MNVAAAVFGDAAVQRQVDDLIGVHEDVAD